MCIIDMWFSKKWLKIWKIKYSTKYKIITLKVTNYYMYLFTSCKFIEYLVNYVTIKKCKYKHRYNS